MKRQQNQAFGRNWKKGASTASKKTKTSSVKKKKKTIKVVSQKKEVYSLDKDCHAWNVDGSCTDTLYKTSWIKFWEEKTGLKRDICSFADCNKKAQVGGHIWLKRKGPHIAPICNGCNYIRNVKRCQSDDGKHSTFRKGTTVVRVELTEDMKNADRRIATSYESGDEEASNEGDEADDEEEWNKAQSYFQLLLQRKEQHKATKATELPLENIGTNPLAAITHFAIKGLLGELTKQDSNEDTLLNEEQIHVSKKKPKVEAKKKAEVSKTTVAKKDSKERKCTSCSCDISDRPASFKLCLRCWRQNKKNPLLVKAEKAVELPKENEEQIHVSKKKPKVEAKKKAEVSKTTVARKDSKERKCTSCSCDISDRPASFKLCLRCWRQNKKK